MAVRCCFYFFFQAEDGIRDYKVTGVQTCALPISTYLLERLVSRCAWQLNLSQAEIRRRNFVTSFPYQTPVALQYDVGDYGACMDKAEALADVAGFAARRADSEARGDRKSTRLNSSHLVISYAVFCLKK